MVDRLKRIWWVPVVGIYGLARIVSFLLFLSVASIQEDNYWTSARPGYFDFLNIWDVEWYERIFSSGYPSNLPLTESGSVQQNNWAFFPVFPYFIRGLNFFTGIEWKILAPLVATAVGFLFAVMAYKLLELRFSRDLSLWAVALISFSMASPILQTGYAESFALFFAASALYCYLTRRYWWLAISLTALSLTRPGVIAFALFFGALWLVNLIRQKRFAAIEFGFAWLSGFLGVLWLLIAALVTGRSDAYLQTELAWRAGYMDASSFVPFTGWFASGRFHIGQTIGEILVALLILIVAVAMFLPSVRALGLELRLWVASYLFYLFAVFFPQSSTPRILFPAFPLLAAFAIATERVPRWGKVGLIALSVLGQVGWLLLCWKYTAPDYTPP